MVVDVYAFVANCTQCARNRVGKRRKTNYLKTFPPTEPLTDLCMDLLGPLPWTAAGNEHLSVILDRFSKMTRAIPLQRIDAETIAAAFLDHWVAAYGPPVTVLSDNDPEFRSTFFQGVCSLLGVSNRYYTTYHPQTNGQVEQYNRTIVGQLRTYVEDHQDRWDELVSMLTLAYDSRPQQSTRGCHGYIPDEYIHALYPYPLRIRAGNACSKCIMRKRGQGISILSDKNCKIISDPYSRYERQDTGIYKIIELLGPTAFRYNAVHLSFPNPTIGRFMCKQVAATSGTPARPGRSRSSTRLGPFAISAKCDTSFRPVYLTTVYKNGGELPGPRPLGRTHQM